MALRGESGWQTEKTLAECMRYTFDNEIGTDVIFEVGPPDGDTVNIRAHKVILISRCEVFEAMFSSGMAECKSGPYAMVRVVDIHPDIFKDLLLYIYGEVVSVTVETAPSLVYAARKYMLPALVRECGVCLSEVLKVNNVVQILETSFIIEDTDLESNCRRLIVQEAETFFTGTEILSASTQTMGVIIQMERIPLKEAVIYNTCIAWAKHQFQLNNLLEDQPTDLQIREILGDLLFKIRFPIMEATEFAEISEYKSILTPDEKMSILYYLATKVKGPQLLFPTESRGFGEEVWIERTVTRVATNSWNAPPVVDAIDFTVNQDILLTGVGLYIAARYTASYEAVVEILQSTKHLFKKNLNVTNTGDDHQIKVSMDEPVFLKAGVLYSVVAVSSGTIGHYGKPCAPVCTKGEVTFNFAKNHQSYKTDEICGQIPRLYFRF